VLELMVPRGGVGQFCNFNDLRLPTLPDAASRKVAEAFAKYPNWQRSEAELRELRNQVTFALMRVEDDVEKVTATVEALFTLLRKTVKP
jgi:type I restriction enzyme, R subunit